MRPRTRIHPTPRISTGAPSLSFCRPQDTPFLEHFDQIIPCRHRFGQNRENKFTIMTKSHISNTIWSSSCAQSFRQPRRQTTTPSSRIPPPAPLSPCGRNKLRPSRGRARRPRRAAHWDNGRLARCRPTSYALWLKSSQGYRECWTCPSTRRQNTSFRGS